MKIHTFITALLLAAPVIQAQGIAQPRPLLLPAGMETAKLKDAGRSAITQVINEFISSGSSSSTSYIILPLTKDVDLGYFTLQFENAFTQSAQQKNFKLYTRSDKVLEKVLTEIEFQQNYADSLDASTAQKLALVGAASVILPRIDIDPSSDGSHTLRASIGIHDVKTGQKVWGGESSVLIQGPPNASQWIMRGIMLLAALALLMIGIWFKRTVQRGTRAR